MAVSPIVALPNSGTVVIRCLKGEVLMVLQHQSYEE